MRSPTLLDYFHAPEVNVQQAIMKAIFLYLVDSGLLKLVHLSNGSCPPVPVSTGKCRCTARRRRV
ncbi:hypothetical protein C8Q79DRAFT_1013678 [Trametes meyenii]|nr:hypothetical protein C8Q79DRAFT_1013678 [Trametes meyenii]